MALHPELLEHIFSQNAASTEDGQYTILLFKEGCWRQVKVLDTLPVDEFNELLYVRSNDSSELWPSLLEKAYAK